MLKKWIYNFYLVYVYARKSCKIYFKGTEKSSIKIALDLLSWLIREKSFNSMYFAFGLNLRERKNIDFIGRKEFTLYKNKVERHLKNLAGADKLDYDIITKDKFYFNSVLEANHLACTRNIALISNSIIINLDNGISGSIEDIYSFHFPLFIKNTVLEYNEGILKCDIKDGSLFVNGNAISLSSFKERLANRQWVVQPVYKSHPQIAKINSTALNTTRIVTIMNGNREPEYLAGFQAFADQSEISDSWGNGAVYVGIDPGKNCLKKYGFYHPTVGSESMIERHPSKEIFYDGYKIDELGNAIELCINAHRILYYNFIIGWDVAITPEGPVIVEANEKPGMNAVQCTDGGVRKKIIENGKSIFKIRL